MKNLYTLASTLLLAFLFILGCNTKEINLEMTSDHKDNGFVKDSLKTTIILTPQRTDYLGFSYYVNYKVVEGEGYYLAADSTRLPVETDILLSKEEEFTANWHYVGQTPGVHKILINAKDNYEKEKVATLAYTLKPITLLWEVTSPQTMAEVNNTIPFRLELENKSIGSVLTYKQTIRVSKGSGLILDANKKPVTLNKTLSVSEGVLNWYYVGATAEQHKIQFDLEASNGIKKSTVLDFDVKEELKNAAPTAVADFTETFATRSIEVDVLGNDADPEGDALSIISVEVPNNGEAIILDGKVVYTPNASFIGKEVFDYTIIGLYICNRIIYI